MRNEIVFHSGRCNGCGLCAQTCPQMVFAQRSDGNTMRIAHPERCIGCLACDEDCPQGALVLGLEVHRLPPGMSLDEVSAPGFGLDTERVYDLAVVGAGPAWLGAAWR